MNMIQDFRRYPRTMHIQGSGIQSDDLTKVATYGFLKGKPLTIEEKLDGGCSAVRFDSNRKLYLQSRGHYLTGGDPEYWNDFKTWAYTWQPYLWEILNTRYVMFGEYLKVFHSVYYDWLPSYFAEFDVYDTTRNVFLSTEARMELFKDVRIDIFHVPVLAKNVVNPEEILSLLTVSQYITDLAYVDLEEQLINYNIPGKTTLLALNEKRLAEGLYIKWEEDGIVKGRYKYVRPEFVNSIIEQGVHWKKRARVFNRIADDNLPVYAP